ncbi:uncharacterized protein Dsimw501_GD28791 [Drosophila simulans]|nr:uncharacterized protein Dsimw501_GD28791 [Drosophila simulans]
MPRNTSRAPRDDSAALRLHAMPGQEVFRRNFVPSGFRKAFNAKFARLDARSNGQTAMTRSLSKTGVQ